MISKIWTVILLLTALANAVTGIMSAVHGHYDQGSYFVGMAILTWLFARETEK